MHYNEVYWDRSFLVCKYKHQCDMNRKDQELQEDTIYWKKTLLQKAALLANVPKITS